MSGSGSSSESSSELAERWYLLPIEPYERPEGMGEGRRPKYLTEADIRRWGGTIDTIDHPAIGPEREMYVVWVEARTDVLDDLSAYEDTYDETQASRSQIVDYLNRRYSADRSFSEWAALYRGGAVQ